MNEANLIEQFADALRRDPKAAPPPGLDPATAEAVRALVLSQRALPLEDSLSARMWHRALSQAEATQAGLAAGKPSAGSNNNVEHLRLLKPNERISMEEGGSTNTAASLLPGNRVAPRTRPPTVRHFWQYTLTIAAAILIVVLIGGLLVEMVNNPVDGYPAVESLDTPEPTPGCTASTDYMAAGEADISAGEYDAARTAYECAIEIDPTNYAAYVLRGGLAGAGGDYDQLAYDLHLAFSHRITGSDPLALSLVRLMPTLTAAIQSRPEDSTLYLLRGLAAFISDLRTNALNDFETLMTLAPENAIGYLLHWAIKPEANQLTDDDISASMELAPDSVLADWVVSLIFTQGIAEAWSPRYEDAIGRNPSHPFAYEARGLAHVFGGDVAAATDDFYQHIQLQPGETAEENELTLGEAFAINGLAGDVYRLTFTAQAGQTLNVIPAKVYAPTNWIYPPTLVVLDPAGEAMPAPYEMQSALGVSETPIRGLDIWESGVYTLLLTPNSSGAMTITISETN